MTASVPQTGQQAPSDGGPAGEMKRELGLLPATSLNVANMIGIGPFITIPIFIQSMQGPHALIAWVIAAVLVVCDGLVWSELGAALPGSGGTYHFLKEIFGSSRLGRALPFLFLWQFVITGTLEMASGYAGSMPYLEYIFPRLSESLTQFGIQDAKPWLAAATVFVVAGLLSRRIGTIGWLGVLLTAGSVITVLTVIASGVPRISGEALRFPEGAFTLNAAFFVGLAGSMRIAIYDYLGYYNVCHLGDEVKDPGRTIPRAVLISIALVATVYLTMNIAIICVVPWQKAMESKQIAADFMEVLYGRKVAVAFTWMILWTAFACVFAIMLGYSRILYAAARRGDFFSIFGKMSLAKGYPWVSLWVLAGLTAVFCFFPLGLVIESAVTIRIAVQFLGQIWGLHVLRTRQPNRVLPFRMWLYPVPSMIAAVGWCFILLMKHPDYGWLTLAMAAGVNGVGLIVYFAWSAMRGGPKRGGAA